MSMQTSEYRMPVRLLLRIFVPSLTSLLGSLLIALSIIGIKLLQAAPTRLSGSDAYSVQLLTHYTSFISHPLFALLHNTTVNSVGMIVLWGAIGLGIAEVLATAASLLARERAMAHEVQFSSTGTVTPHPLTRTFFMRILWHFLIIMLAFIFTLWVIPVANSRLLQTTQAMLMQNQVNFWHALITALALLTGIFFAYVVLLRLYLLRTRVFGEILY